MKCKDCKHYEPECQYQEGDPIRWKKWGNCKNPNLDIGGDFINAGADDDYGAFWHITGDFGCIFCEDELCLKKRSGCKFIIKAKCNCREQHLYSFNDILLCSCPHFPPYNVLTGGEPPPAYFGR